MNSSGSGAGWQAVQLLEGFGAEDFDLIVVRGADVQQCPVRADRNPARPVAGKELCLDLPGLGVDDGNGVPRSFDTKARLAETEVAAITRAVVKSSGFTRVSIWG